jgi:hypothetical protein
VFPSRYSNLKFPVPEVRAFGGSRAKLPPERHLPKFLSIGKNHTIAPILMSPLEI